MISPGITVSMKKIKKLADLLSRLRWKTECGSSITDRERPGDINNMLSEVEYIGRLDKKIRGGKHRICQTADKVTGKPEIFQAAMAGLMERPAGDDRHEEHVPAVYGAGAVQATRVIVELGVVGEEFSCALVN
ncbi:hypothetical protein HG530_013311 [Fusarium avenaceum]|nr:hypothetical protein HG530_013311 [Fusarium avenaceum]